MTAGRSLRIGLSATKIESALGGPIDGIGTYTRALLAAFRSTPALGVQAVPISFPRPGYRNVKSDFADGRFFPFSFVPSLAASRISGRPFFGSTRVSHDLDLFHSTDYRVPDLGRIPMVATLCDAIPVKYPQWTSGGPLAIVRARVLRAAARNAHHVIAISHAAVADLVEYFLVAPERVSVVPLGVEATWFDVPDEARLRDVQIRYALPPRFVLSVGTLQPRKNVESILAAHRALPATLRRDAPLLVVGKAGWQAKNLLTELHKDSRQAFARWLDYVPGADLRVIYRLASAFVFPSLYEGFGLPVLEAFAAQVPVVAANTTSLPEVAGDAALLVPPKDIDAIAQAMSRLLTDDGLASDLRARGLERARTFTWGRCAELTLEVYRRVLDGRS